MARKITMDQVNQALREEFGGDIEICQGEGFFYFTGKIPMRWQTSRVPAASLDEYSVGEWVEHAVEFEDGWCRYH